MAQTTHQEHRVETGITCLFVDVGGVLLTDGWIEEYRGRAAVQFKLDLKELEKRHHQVFTTHELGKMSLRTYLDMVVFYTPRIFSQAEFVSFMFAQSHEFPEMIRLVKGLKSRYGLKVVLLNNEGKELNQHRIKTFGLDQFADVCISSCHVHLRKPDVDIFRLALEVAHVEPHHVAYLENTSLFVDVANSLGIMGVLHTDYESTVTKLGKLGLIAEVPVSLCA